MAAIVRRHPRLFGGIAILLLLYAGVRVYERIVGTSITVRFSGLIWIPISERSWFLPEGIRLALHRPAPAASAGTIAWHEVLPGFEAGELPVLAGGKEVDRILFARIDPARYRFAVRNDPSGRTLLEGWTRREHALLVVNGSYFARDGTPATPVVIDGRRAGPTAYDAKQGLFVAGPGSAAIVDLEHRDWHEAIRGAEAAMVSYPMLIGENGANRAPRGSGWLANRSFLAQDGAGRILIGTTRSAFFSLDRLGDFLKAAPLDLRLAIDLDGGPVACQAIDAGGFRRAQCGKWEIQVDAAGKAKMLPTWPWSRPSMPMALVVLPR